MSYFINNGQLDRSRLSHLINNDIVDKICNILLPLTPQDDMFGWGPNVSGNFFVKSATWIQNKNINNNNISELLKKMWKEGCIQETNYPDLCAML